MQELRNCNAYACAEFEVQSRVTYPMFTYPTRGYPTGQACHVGDHAAGHVHPRACQLFLETSLRASSSVSSRCIIHSSTSTFILPTFSIPSAEKMPYTRVINFELADAFR